MMFLRVKYLICWRSLPLLHTNVYFYTVMRYVSSWICLHFSIFIRNSIRALFSSYFFFRFHCQGDRRKGRGEKQRT